jgi:hypothetical protein
MVQGAGGRNPSDQTFSDALGLFYLKRKETASATQAFRSALAKRRKQSNTVSTSPPLCLKAAIRQQRVEFAPGGFNQKAVDRAASGDQRARG